MNQKLTDLQNAFLRCGGEVYIGQDAWDHLDNLAGETMAVFLDTYVREPMNQLFLELPDVLPDLTLSQSDSEIKIIIGGDVLHIKRHDEGADPGDRDTAPDDLFLGIDGR